MWFLKKRKRKSVDANHQKYKLAARELVHHRLQHFAPQCGVMYRRVAIRNTKRSWGSCSSLGNLNFNYKVLFLPQCLRDYIIVHELCHLKELNHGEKFWFEVGLVVPDYDFLKNELRRLEKTHGTSPQALVKYHETHVCQYCSEPAAPNISF